MIHAFLLNLLLAGVYTLLVGDLHPVNYIVGFAIGYIVITIYGFATGTPSYGMRMLRLFRFSIYFLYILTKANLEIAWEIITPGMHQTPRIIRYPVSDLNDVEMTTLANCITLTPGTLVVDVSDDGAWLYVHCMYAKNPQDAIAGLDELADRLRKEVFA